MRYLFGLLCVCSLGLVPMVGCSETTGEGGSGGDAGSGGSAGDGGSGGEVVEYRLMFTAIAPDGFIVPVQDVQTCEADTENCALSDETGTLSLNVLPDQEILFTIEKEGYGKWLMADVSDDTRELVGVTGRRMHTDAELQTVADQLGVDYPWTGGIVGLVINPSEVGGLTFAPAGTTVGEVGESFYYDSATEAYSLVLDAGTEVAFDWNLPLGAGGFTEVTPGEQQFEFGGTAGNCVASWAWPGDTPNTIRVPVREGYRTYGSMICTAQ